MDEELEAIRKANNIAHEANVKMIEDHLTHSSIVIAQQAAMKVQGVASNPNFTSGGTL
jgi:hypothetical protein